MLVDTGAAVTMMDRQVYQQISERHRPASSPCGQSLFTVSGEPMLIDGEAIFELTFLDKLVKFPVLVGPLGLSSVLGLDFMEKNN
jgi:hypothetical protein